MKTDMNVEIWPFTELCPQNKTLASIMQNHGLCDEKVAALLSGEMVHWRLLKCAQSSVVRSAKTTNELCNEHALHLQSVCRQPF